MLIEDAMRATPVEGKDREEVWAEAGAQLPHRPTAALGSPDWPFRSVPNPAEAAKPFYSCISLSLDEGHPKTGMTMGGKLCVAGTISEGVDC